MKNGEKFSGQAKIYSSGAFPEERNECEGLQRCECHRKIMKEANKSKSRVWKKVTWFTKKNKGGKLDSCQCEELENNFQRDLVGIGEAHSNSWSFTRTASRKFRLSSRERQCKSDNTRELFLGQGKNVLGCGKARSRACGSGSYGAVNPGSPTATGNFCDFESNGCVNSKVARKTKKASFLTEIARELNPPAGQPLKDVNYELSHHLSKSRSSSSLSYTCVRKSPVSVHSVRRCKSFSGLFDHSFAQKRRNTQPQRKMLASLSPPLKQKCFGLRRTTTFRGKLHTELLNVHIQKSKSDETADFGKLEKGSLSLGEIRDQDGSIIGIVHFYKSPKSSCMRKLNSFSYGITRPEASSQRSSSDKPTCKKIYESSNMPKNPQATYTSSQFEETVNLSNCNELDDTNPSPKKFSSLQNSQNSDICQVNDSGFCESDWETDIQSIDPILPVQMVGELESEVKCESLSDGRVVDTLRDVNAESLNSTLQGISLSQGNASVKENRPTKCSTEEKLVLVNDLPDISLWNMHRMPHNIMENQDIHGTVEEGGDCGKGVPFAKDQTFLEMYTNKNNSEIQKPFNCLLTNYLADQTSCQSNRNQNISGILGGSNKFCQNLGDNCSKEIDGNKYEQNDNLGLNFVKISPNNSHETIWSSLSMDSLDDAAMKDLKISKSELPKVQDCETRVTDINLKSTEISSTDAYISGIKKELNIHENKEFDFYKKNNQERLPEAEIQLSELSQRGAAEGKPVLTKAFDTSDCSFICGGILQDGDSSKTSIREVQKTYLSCTNKSVANCKNDKVCFLENSGTAGGIWQKVSPHEEIPDKKSVSIFSYIMGHMDSGKVQNDMTPVLASSNTSEYASCSDEDQSNQNDVPLSMWKASEKSETKDNGLSLPVPGPVFKMRTELILKWFEEFNDEQKNIVMKKLLNRCGLPQMHLMSVAMEPKLHKTCPPNCQDMLVWLPYPVVLKILMYLDPASLCCCNQVNKAWNKLTNNPLLWQQLTRNPDYRLSETSSRKQYMKYTRQNGDIHWKKVFAERFLLKKNWLNGTYQLRTCKGHEQGIACVQFDDTRIVSGSSDKTIKLWDITGTTPELILTLEGHSGTVRCLDLNGNRLVSGSTDRTIKVWDISFDSFWTGASCKVTMVGHLHTVRCLQADDKKLVSGSYDKTVKVWDLKTGQCQLTLRGHTAAVLCVQFDDQKIVSGSYDKKIKVWDLTEGSCLMTLDGHQDAVTCLNLTHDGMKIITGSLDYSLKFWDLFTGKCYGTLDWIRSEGHTAVVRCLQVDNWRIISGGDDKTLKVWELATGQRLLTLRYHSDGVTCMQFSDFAIVSGSYDRTVKLWDFTPKHPYLEAVT